MLPLTRLIWIVTLCLVAIMLGLVFLGQKTGETIIERNRRFLVVAAAVSLGAFVARQLLLLLQKLVGWSLLGNIADVCFWLCAAGLGGLAIVFHFASEEAKQKALQDLLRPLNIVNNYIRNNKFQGATAIGNQNARIDQTAIVSVSVQKQIYTFMDQVAAAPPAELSPELKQEAIEHLHTLADQSMRTERREESKIMIALKRLPAIFSGTASLVEAWEKIAPVVKAHLGL